MFTCTAYITFPANVSVPVLDFQYKNERRSSCDHNKNCAPEQEVVHRPFIEDLYNNRGASFQHAFFDDDLNQLSRFNVASFLQGINHVSEGKRIHDYILRNAIQQDVFVGNLLVSMYSKYGALDDAFSVFDQMHQRNVISWNAMIAGYSKHGQGEKALQLLQQMQEEGLYPNRITFSCLLGIFDSPEVLADGRIIHQYIIESGLEPNAFLVSALVNMYSKCGDLEEAQCVFKGMHQPNVICWNALLTAYSSHGHENKSLQVFSQMQRQGVQPDKVTFILVLSACARLAALAEGTAIHACIRNSGLECNVMIENALLNMYGKCGALDDALSVFYKMHKRNVVSWTAMIDAYSQQGCRQEALELFRQMQHQGLQPNEVTLISILAACTTVDEGKAMHACIVDGGFESDIVVGSALVDMYGKCGSLEDSCTIFHKMHQHNVVSWTSMINAYSQHGCGRKSLELFQQMQQAGVEPDKVTLIGILGACTPSVAPLTEGKAVHAFIIDSRLESDACLGNALVSMYGNYGALEDAQAVFDKMHQHTTVSWNAMMDAYAQHGYGGKALQLFQEMLQLDIEPDRISFICVLGVCTTLDDLTEGKTIHACIVESEFASDVFTSNALVFMYGQHGALQDAVVVFDNMVEHNTVSWNAVIAAYAQHGNAEKAFQLCQQMMQQGAEPNEVTFISALAACTIPETLPDGKAIHACINDCGFQFDLAVTNALVNMYGKCGALEDAFRVFNKMHERNVLSWNSMIGTCSRHGHGKDALQLFEQMQEYIEPNAVTFVCLLSACSHAGLFDEGRQLFSLMTEKHGIEPTLEHYGCMIDLLGRSGTLEVAENLIYKIPFQPDSHIWRTLLGACKLHGDVDRGKRATKHLLELDPQTSAGYVLLSDICAADDRWDVKMGDPL